MRRREFVIEQNKVGVKLVGGYPQLIDLAAPDQRSGVGLVANLHQRIDDLGARADGKFGELCQRLLGFFDTLSLPFAA